VKVVGHIAMNKKVLIIGDAGYVGSRLYSHLQATKKYELDGFDLCLWGRPDKSHTGWQFADYGFIEGIDLLSYSVVVLLAGNSSPGMSKDLQDTYDQNVHKFMRLVKTLKAYNPKVKFIYASSASVAEGLFVPENMAMSTPQNPYDATKQVIDKLMACETELEYYGLRFGTVAGASPNMRWELLLNSLFYDASTKGHTTVSSPENMRAVLGLNDLCRAVETIIINSEEDKRGFYNLTSFNSSIGSAALNVQSYFEIDHNKYITTQIVEGNSTYSFSVDTEKFEKAFDFDFKDGILSIMEELEKLNLPEDKQYFSRSRRRR
jgi:nucleoside-diphosphate-sugar epimerase